MKALYVSFLSARESERKTKRQQALIVLCQRPVKLQTKATRGRQYRRQQGHNLPAETVIYNTPSTLCRVCIKHRHT